MSSCKIRETFYFAADLDLIQKS